MSNHEILIKKVSENKGKSEERMKEERMAEKVEKTVMVCSHVVSGRLNLMKRYINEQIYYGLAGSRNLQVLM